MSKLTSQENALKNLEDGNNILASPALMLQQSRLDARGRDLQTQVYKTLKTQLEMVQIEENESNGKIMEVLDPPEKPILPKSPKLETVIFCVLNRFFADARFVYYKTGRLNYYIRRYFILTT